MRTCFDTFELIPFALCSNIHWCVPSSWLFRVHATRKLTAGSPAFIQHPLCSFPAGATRSRPVRFSFRGCRRFTKAWSRIARSKRWPSCSWLLSLIPRINKSLQNRFAFSPHSRNNVYYVYRQRVTGEMVFEYFLINLWGMLGQVARGLDNANLLIEHNFIVSKIRHKATFWILGIDAALQDDFVLCFLLNKNSRMILRYLLDLCSLQKLRITTNVFCHLSQLMYFVIWFCLGISYKKWIMTNYVTYEPSFSVSS